MVVIKHREEEKRHNYYKVTCDCGCVFAFEESEFENTRAVGSKIVFVRQVSFGVRIAKKSILMEAIALYQFRLRNMQNIPDSP